MKDLEKEEEPGQQRKEDQGHKARDHGTHHQAKERVNLKIEQAGESPANSGLNFKPLLEPFLGPGGNGRI